MQCLLLNTAIFGEAGPISTIKLYQRYLGYPIVLIKQTIWEDLIRNVFKGMLEILT